jgi:DNA-binding IscR family transcriptional regulator
MKFQKTTEYALQIMAFLSRAKDRPVASSELHRHLSIPRKYL